MLTPEDVEWMKTSPYFHPRFRNLMEGICYSCSNNTPTEHYSYKYGDSSNNKRVFITLCKDCFKQTSLHTADHQVLSVQEIFTIKLYANF